MCLFNYFNLLNKEIMCVLVLLFWEDGVFVWFNWLDILFWRFWFCFGMLLVGGMFVLVSIEGVGLLVVLVFIGWGCLLNFFLKFLFVFL